MIDITVTGKSILLRQFHQYLIDKFGVRKVIADLPDCMKQGVVINKVTASFYVDDNFFDKNNLSEEGFRQLDISVLVNNGIKISKRKYGRIIVYNMFVKDDFASNKQDIDMFADLRDRIDDENYSHAYKYDDENIELKDFEDLETYEERTRRYLRV